MVASWQVSKRSIVLIELLCVTGIFISGYLAWLHYQVHTNPTFHSFCAMNDSFNCETVAESPYAVFLFLPVAIWGLLGYSLMLIVSVLGLHRDTARAAFVLLSLLALLAVIVSSALAYISYCVICSLCIMCSLSYVVNLFIVILLFRIAVVSKFSLRQGVLELLASMRCHFKAVAVASILFALVVLSFPAYWEKVDFDTLRQVQRGVTKEGYPWIGAEKPTLTIVEYSDYFCPFCRKAHLQQRKLVLKNRNKVRLLHRHFPLDEACNPLIKRPFHPGACVFAHAAICAEEQEQFWEMNDLLYAKETLVGQTWKAQVENAARKLGLNVTRFRQCLSSSKAQEAVQNDIQDALALKLRGTPSFLIGDRVFLGSVDPEFLASNGLELLSAKGEG